MPTDPSTVVTVTDWAARLRLQGAEQPALVGCAEHHVDRAVPLTQPLPEHEHRRRAVALADDGARDRLPRQRERPPDRSEDVDPVVRRADPTSQRVAGPRTGKTTSTVPP